MNKLRMLVAAGVMAFATVAHADEWTANLAISRLLFDGTGTTTIYFENATGHWSAASCPNAQYVIVRNIAGMKEILAMGLAAKTAASNVKFLGTCQDANYFAAYYMVVE
jgi:hypothetical protein